MAIDPNDPISGVISALAAQQQPQGQKVALDMSDLLRPKGIMPGVEYGLPEGMGTKPFSNDLVGPLNRLDALKKLLGGQSPMVPNLTGRIRIG